MLEYPIWLVTGCSSRVTLLPGWVEPIAWVLAPTWGVAGDPRGALGGDPLAAIAMCVVLLGASTSCSARSRCATSSGSRGEQATLSLT